MFESGIKSWKMKSTVLMSMAGTKEFVNSFQVLPNFKVLAMLVYLGLSHARKLAGQMNITGYLDPYATHMDQIHACPRIHTQ